MILLLLSFLIFVMGWAVVVLSFFLYLFSSLFHSYPLPYFLSFFLAFFLTLSFLLSLSLTHSFPFSLSLSLSLSLSYSLSLLLSLTHTGTKTKISRVGNNLGGLYDTSQINLFPVKDQILPEEFLSDPSVMDQTPVRTDAPKYYELMDNVLCSFSKVLKKNTILHIISQFLVFFR